MEVFIYSLKVPILAQGSLATFALARRSAPLSSKGGDDVRRRAPAAAALRAHAV